MNQIMRVPKPVLLSALWIFVMFNMIFADIVGWLTPGFFDQIGELSQLLTPMNLLMFAILLEIPIAMVLLSRVLSEKANRWAHAIAVPVTIIFVVGGGSFAPHYIFFASMEILAMVTALYVSWQAAPERQLEMAV